MATQTGDRITWTHEVGKKRCLLIEAELSGTILSIEGNNYTIAVDSYDGMTVPVFNVMLDKAIVGA